ncbi:MULTISPECIES: VOC family protein [Erythrobacter]|jgi:catechol 2,3-dioxygenase-like lactoylglutathione lyase family enzyme|uniref:VOC family protein n=1 Tax=Erythrobacter aureus TaxID=2182384 RepID=A0A345YCF9_9SPHN|nr:MULTISPECIES: VOC family protein [Erythrobacter]AXK41611.1 VOC family protein [Erythrobacter aureus]MBQ94282.1 glyoxalase [Actinomycetota bacterium]MCF8883294.1 VOC family protein [Erythrobacter sp. SN021]|tara:strand:- start:1301 stop:1693 length:393 start_codon:yes stop_codon:yes gene_type:complete
MFNHIMIGTNDIDKAKAFYEKVLKVVGCEMAIDNTDAKGNKRVFFMHNGGTFCLTQPIDGEAATCANGMTIGFKCDSGEQVKELHDAAIAAGGTSIEDPPGPRQNTMGTMHLSYFRDLDGHKICGIHREA